MKMSSFVVVLVLCKLMLSCHGLTCQVGYQAKLSIGQPINKMASQECPDDGKIYKCIKLDSKFTVLLFSGEGSIGQCVVDGCGENSPYCSDPLKLLPDVHSSVPYHVSSCDVNCCTSDDCNSGD